MKGKILSVKRNNGNDYINVQLPEGNGSIEENYYIHILVAETFIPNPENKPTVNHKDGDKSHNYVENLEWATQSEQIIHAIDTGLRNKIKLDKKSAKEVYDLTQSNLYTIKEIADIYNISKTVVFGIKNKKIWKRIHN